MVLAAHDYDFALLHTVQIAREVRLRLREYRHGPYFNEDGTKLTRAAVLDTWPLTLTLNSSPAQTGRRRASVNFLDDSGVSLTVAVCPIGRSVATSTFTPADFHSAMEGAYRRQA